VTNESEHCPGLKSEVPQASIFISLSFLVTLKDMNLSHVLKPTVPKKLISNGAAYLTVSGASMLSTSTRKELSLLVFNPSRHETKQIIAVITGRNLMDILIVFMVSDMID
jgi:hypothetical protein